jgi:outer membrane autotransporter protein
VSGRFETGYNNNFDWYNITPLVGFNFTALHVNGFTETNAGRPSAVGLSFAGKDVYSLPAFLGAQFDARQQLANGGSLYGWLRTEWVHEFLPHRTVDPSFIAAPGFGFVVEGAAAPTDLARISMGGKVALNDSVSVTADVRADIYHTPSYSGFAGVRVAW